jgi:CrcB protein
MAFMILREMTLVAAGGSLGALARYGIGLAAGHWLGKSFPWGTLAVNVIGCFIMGIVLEVLLDWEPLPAAPLNRATSLNISLLRHGVAIGFLGALTTFSTFGADTIRHLQAGLTLAAFLNIAANLVLSLAAVWAGMALMQVVD